MLVPHATREFKSHCWNLWASSESEVVSCAGPVVTHFCILDNYPAVSHCFLNHGPTYCVLSRLNVSSRADFVTHNRQRNLKCTQ
jgi:hypothetical protein